MKKIDIAVILFMLIVSLLTLSDLWTPHFFTSHDGSHQIVRLYYFDNLLREGQFPPRYAMNLLNGFGYPLFNFSYTLPWMLAEPLVVAGLSYFSGIKAVFFLGFFFSAVTMYLLQKNLFNAFAATAGTLLYLFAPFRFSNIFVRAAIGDATIFIFPPVLFLALFQMSKKKNLSYFWIIISSFSLSAMILSHAMVAQFYYLFFMVFCGMLILIGSQRKKWLIISIFTPFISFLFSAYYFLPAVFEKGLTKFSSVINSNYHESNFLALRELLYSTWGYGTMRAPEGAMSLQVGIAQWIVFFMAVVLLIKYIKRKQKSFLLMVLFSVLTFILTIFLMTGFSKPIWRIISSFVFIDFPWRLLSLTVFSASILGGFIIHSVKTRSVRYILAVFLVTLAIYGNRNHLRINKIQDWPLEFYLHLETSTNSHDEYASAWAHTDFKSKPVSVLKFYPAGTDIEVIKESSVQMDLNLNLPFEGRVVLNKFYYPGIKIFLNSEEQKVTFLKKYGLITLNLPVGKSNVRLLFTETVFRTAANIVSIVSVLFALFIIYLSGNKMIYKKKNK